MTNVSVSAVLVLTNVSLSLLLWYRQTSLNAPPLTGNAEKKRHFSIHFVTSSPEIPPLTGDAESVVLVVTKVVLVVTTRSFGSEKNLSLLSSLTGDAESVARRLRP